MGKVRWGYDKWPQEDQQKVAEGLGYTVESLTALLTKKPKQKKASKGGKDTKR